MAQLTPLVNGISYSYSTIRVNILGVQLYGVSSIEYSTEQTKENIYSIGEQPNRRGRATKNTTGSIELDVADLQALRSAAPGGDILNIPMFDIVVVFENPPNVVTHVIKNVDFTNDGQSGTTGDTDLKTSLNFVASHVQYV